jgi:hypothetical protein
MGLLDVFAVDMVYTLVVAFVRCLSHAGIHNNGAVKGWKPSDGRVGMRTGISDVATTPRRCRQWGCRVCYVAVDT